MQSAVTVMEPLTGNEAVIVLSPDDDAQDIVDRLNGR